MGVEGRGEIIKGTSEAVPCEAGVLSDSLKMLLVIHPCCDS